MYSVVLMMALSTPVQAADRHHRSSCCGCYTSCCGGCYGSYWGGCCGSYGGYDGGCGCNTGWSGCGCDGGSGVIAGSGVMPAVPEGTSAGKRKEGKDDDDGDAGKKSGKKKKEESSDDD